MLRHAFLLGLLALTPGFPAHRYTEVLVAANQNSPESVGLAHHFVARRAIPPENLVLLDCPGEETIPREVFDRSIHWPLLRHLARSPLGPRVKFLVLMRGVPIRIEAGRAAASPERTMRASVDSELTLLRWELMDPRHLPPLEGPLANPYFHADPELRGTAGFDSRLWPLTLVTRLDGFSADDVRALIARADTPRRPGRFAIDLRDRPDLPPGEEELLIGAARRLRGLGMAVSLETTQTVLEGLDDLSGLASWGSNDPAQTTRWLDLGFRPGAIACPLVSTNMRTFVAPPPAWDYAGWEAREQFYAGSPQSLAGDLIQGGVAGISGNVWEPHLAATARPDIALPAYARGYTLAEAFYQAMPVISWMGIVVGDPLCRLAVESAPE